MIQYTYNTEKMSDLWLDGSYILNKKTLQNLLALGSRGHKDLTKSSNTVLKYNKTTK